MWGGHWSFHSGRFNISKEIGYKSRHFTENEEKSRKKPLKSKGNKFSMVRKGQQCVAECRRYGNISTNASVL
jgi:endonuclease YncB( thermonuclease family)